MKIWEVIRMNNRQQRIIDILHDYDEWVTGKELASMLSVSIVQSVLILSILIKSMNVLL